ncbi:MAG: hypothetical protein R2822_12095 [Spirosomataceae bacterium]
MFRTILQNKEKCFKVKSFRLHFRTGALVSSPTSLRLDALIDTRLVGTFYDLFMAILVFRTTGWGCFERVRRLYLWFARSRYEASQQFTSCKKWSYIG